jgi:hypothetical protein
MTNLLYHGTNIEAKTKTEDVYYTAVMDAIHDVAVKKDLDMDDYYCDISSTGCSVDLDILDTNKQLVKDYVEIHMKHIHRGELDSKQFEKAVSRIGKELNACVKKRKDWYCEQNIEETNEEGYDIFECRNTKTGETQRWESENK